MNPITQGLALIAFCYLLKLIVNKLNQWAK